MENNLEQSEVDSSADNRETDPQESKQDSKHFGKFASAADLVKAYTELESAFTRKSQELAELRGSVSVTKNEKACEAPVQPAAPAVIAGTGSGFAFTSVPEAVTLRAVTKTAENYFRSKGRE